MRLNLDSLNGMSMLLQKLMDGHMRAKAKKLTIGLYSMIAYYVNGPTQFYMNALKRGCDRTFCLVFIQIRYMQ